MVTLDELVAIALADIEAERRNDSETEIYFNLARVFRREGIDLPLCDVLRQSKVFMHYYSDYEAHFCPAGQCDCMEHC